MYVTCSPFLNSADLSSFMHIMCCQRSGLCLLFPFEHLREPILVLLMRQIKSVFIIGHYICYLLLNRLLTPELYPTYHCCLFMSSDHLHFHWLSKPHLQPLFPALLHRLSKVHIFDWVKFMLFGTCPLKWINWFPVWFCYAFCVYRALLTNHIPKNAMTWNFPWPWLGIAKLSFLELTKLSCAW